MLITKHYSQPQTEWLAKVTMHYDTRVLVETYPRPLSVCVDCFDVEEKWFNFTPYMKRSQTIRGERRLRE